MKKILIDARVLGRGKTSGIEEYTRLLIEYLFEIDSENEYTFFTNGLREPFFPSQWEKKEKVKRLKWRLPNKFLNLSFLVARMPNVDAYARADIVFSPNINILSTSKKTKRIITFHDLSFIHFPEFYMLRSRFWFWFQSYRRQALKADRIIADSDFTAMDIENTLSIPREKIVTVHCGINPFYKKIEEKELISDFRKTCKLEAPFLLFVGVLEPRKNIPSIIRSFSILKEKPQFSDLKLVIVGRKGWLYDTIFREAKSSRFENDIVFWGNASFEEIRFLYNACEAFIYPSFFEGFGFPPLEAQACGAPVISSNRSSIPEILGSSALLTDPWKIGEQVSALESVIGNSSMRGMLIK
ncbi:MAG: glycosyltransferase family 1 protein, partial [Patescibacteria group bacterium]